MVKTAGGTGSIPGQGSSTCHMVRQKGKKEKKKMSKLKFNLHKSLKMKSSFSHFLSYYLNSLQSYVLRFVEHRVNDSFVIAILQKNTTFIGLDNIIAKG